MAHLSRLSTAGQMASGLAHELNQPLAAIMNYASVALLQAESQKTSPPVLLDALREIMNETRRAGAIISRMKTFVRKQQTESAPVEVNALVEESLNLLSFELRHQEIRPRRVLAEKLPLVMADPIQIEQVIVNLVYNAMDAMKGSSPAIDALTIQTALQSGGRAVEVSVVDRGPGIAPDNMARLFEAFFTTKTNGLGMGLNICRTIIESHGGRLEAAANPGGGMRFFFTLPVADGAAS
jgi:C4-dicarboxylate-specific signal transduction histidine kinase